MRGLAYKRASWLSSLKRPSYSKMAPEDTPNLTDENISLLDGQRQKRYCCGLFRMHGSDGVWAWIVAFANFLINFIIVGLGRMSGILYVDFMNLFNIDRKTASIPFSVQQAGRNLFGPVAGILGQKYGLRAVTILGGIIGSLSAATAYFKMDITTITILWGLFFGISTALTTTLNQVSIDQYFEKHRATAGGFAFSGGCVGAFFFPVVIETLITHYGMKGTFLVMGAIILHVIPAAMLLVEPSWKQNQVEIKREAQKNLQYGSLEVGEPSDSAATKPDTEKTNELIETHEIKFLSNTINFVALQANSDIVFQFLTMETSDRNIPLHENQEDSQKLDKMRLLNELECIYSLIAVPNQKEQNRFSHITSQEPDKESHLQVSDSQGAHYKADNSEDKTNVRLHRPIKKYDEIPRRIYIQNKLREIYEAQGTQLVFHFPYADQHRAWKILIELRKLYETLAEIPNFQTISDEPQYFVSFEPKDTYEQQTESHSSKHSNSFWNLFKTAIKLHRKPLFLLICLCRGVFMLTFIPVVTVIVDFAMDKGLPKSDGKYVIAALSLGDFLGRLCLGWITDRGYLSLPRYMLIVMLILGGSTATLPFMNSKISILAAVLFFGILQGSLFVRHPLLISQYMESHEQSIGMGFINFLSGFLGFALPAFIGYFRDTLGSYNKMFFVNGIICASIGLMWTLEPMFVRLSSSQLDRSSNRKVSN